MNKLCIAVRSLRRIDSLRKCLTSLEKNTNLDVDFWFFQDGAVNPFSGKRYATDEEIETSLRAFEESKLPNKHIYQHKNNEGCIPQYYFELEMLVPMYDYIVSIPNDLCFNRYYIKTLNILFEQFRSDYDIGMLQTTFWGFNQNLRTREEAQMLEDKVSYGFGYKTEQGFWADRWPLIGLQMQPFLEMMNGVDYHDLCHNLEMHVEIRERMKKLYGSYKADGVLEGAVKLAGFKGLHTCTQRYKLMGERGLYSFSGSLYNRRFSKVKLYDVGNVERYELLPDWG